MSEINNNKNDIQVLWGEKVIGYGCFNPLTGTMDFVITDDDAKKRITEVFEEGDPILKRFIPYVPPEDRFNP